MLVQVSEVKCWDHGILDCSLRLKNKGLTVSS